jgi:hypothetical protein
MTTKILSWKNVEDEWKFSPKDQDPANTLRYRFHNYIRSINCRYTRFIVPPELYSYLFYYFETDCKNINRIHCVPCGQTDKGEPYFFIAGFKFTMVSEEKIKQLNILE